MLKKKSIRVRKEKREVDTEKAETNVIGLFFKDVRKLDEFTKEQEQELWNRYFAGETKLLPVILKSHMRFVIKTCNEYKAIADFYKVDMSDLYQEASIGLITAGNKFSPDKNVRFISYAVWWVKQAIIAYFNSFSREIRLPVNIVQEVQKQKKKSDTAFKNDEIFDEEQTEVPTVQSIYSKINDDGDELIDVIASEGSETDLDNFSIKKELDKLIDNNKVLNDRERKIIRMYFGFTGDKNCNLEDIGDEMGCTKERVRQIKEQALKKLRTNSKSLFKFK